MKQTLLSELNLLELFNVKDRYLNIISLIITVFSLYYTYYIYKKNKVKKLLTIDKSRTFFLTKDLDSFNLKELKFSWGKKKIENLFLIEIFLKNNGNTKLTEIDFLKPITISFTNEIDILRARLFSSSEFTKIKWICSKQKIECDLSLLEKNKMLKYEIVYSSNNSSPVDVYTKILDGIFENNKIKKHYSYNLYNKDLNDKLYKTTTFHSKALLYILLPLLCLFLIIFYFNSLNLIISIPIRIIMILIITTIGLFKVYEKYTNKMSFINEINWIEFESEKFK